MLCNRAPMRAALSAANTEAMLTSLLEERRSNDKNGSGLGIGSAEAGSSQADAHDAGAADAGLEPVSAHHTTMGGGGAAGDGGGRWAAVQPQSRQALFSAVVSVCDWCVSKNTLAGRWLVSLSRRPCTGYCRNYLENEATVDYRI